MDVAIIGAGPGGYSAALHLARLDLHITIFCGEFLPSNPIAEELEIEEIGGLALSDGLRARLLRFPKVAFISENVVKVVPSFEIHLSSGKIYHAKAMVLATGARPRRLDSEPIDRVGLSYGAIRLDRSYDQAFFKDKTVAILGGGSTAVEYAVGFAKLCRQVELVHRGDWFKVSCVSLDRVLNHPRIRIHRKAQVTIRGQTLSWDKTELTVDWIFCLFGYIPNSEFLQNLVRLSPSGHVVVNDKYQTSQPGCYAVGNVQDDVHQQALTAAAQGMIASMSVEQYLSEKKMSNQ